MALSLAFMSNATIAQKHTIIATQISHPLYPTELSDSVNQFTPTAVKVVSHFIQNNQTFQSAHISTPTV